MLAACSEPEFPTERQYGTNPPLPEPEQYLIPPLAISEPIGWQEDEAPVAPEGFIVTRFAADLHVPRRPGPHPLVVLIHGGYWRVRP